MVIGKTPVASGKVTRIENGMIYVSSGEASDIYNMEYYRVAVEVTVGITLKGGVRDNETKAQQAGLSRDDASRMFRVSTWRQRGSELFQRLDDQTRWIKSRWMLRRNVARKIHR